MITRVEVSDIGLAVLALDRERMKWVYEEAEARRMKAQASLREQFCAEMRAECDKAINKLAVGAAYEVVRANWRDEDE